MVYLVEINNVIGDYWLGLGILGNKSVMKLIWFSANSLLDEGGIVHSLNWV